MRRCYVRDRTVVLEVPVEHMEVAWGRIREFVHACAFEDNFLRAVMLSCYQQGLIDGADVASRGLLKGKRP